MKMSTDQPTFPSLLQQFFAHRLIEQMNVSRQTVASYRDTFRLLLRYVETQTKKSPSTLSFADLDSELILRFLDHLEQDRGNSARTRNVRLTAIRSFMRYASSRDPESLRTIGRVLAIPTKRFEHAVVDFLSKEEINAVLSAPDQTTFSGQRDAVMLRTFYNTGARVSEIIRIHRADVRLEDAYVLIHGKGRKERAVPLWKTTAHQLRQWLRWVAAEQDAPVFPNRRGGSLSRVGVANRVQIAVQRAAEQCPTLRGRRISPHVLRHTTAMHLLQSGVDITVIALWLGHESPTTTHRYIEADLAMKEHALSHLQSPAAKATRYRPGDRLLAFLENL